MGRETILFKTEEKKTASEIAQTLRLIADKVEAGSLTLRSGDQHVELDFPSNMEIQLKAEEEEGRKLKRKFEIEIEWVPGESGQATGTVIE